MALIGSLKPAVSGLRSQQFRIEVVGNNIANVDTPGFKAARAEFATLLSQLIGFGAAPEGSFGGIDPLQIGQGVQISSGSKNFNQGPLEVTGISSDLAVSGEGFFIVRDSSGSQVYTRDGSFGVNSANALYDPSSGGIVQGWLADDDFQINTGGPLSDIEIPIGNLTIANATSTASIQGTLNAGGALSDSGTLAFSVPLFDLTSPNTDLISATNPLGLNRATASTPLENIVFSNGNFVPYSLSTTSPSTGQSASMTRLLPQNPSGVTLSISASKGERSVQGRDFLFGGVPPNGGLTLGDLSAYVQRSLGVTDGALEGIETVERAYSFIRRNPVTSQEIQGTVTDDPGDIFSISGLTLPGSDFRGVEVGDFIRFTSGQAVGEAAEITGVTDTDSDGLPDSLSFRVDGFNSLTSSPAAGDTFTINAAAGVEVAPQETMRTFNESTVTVVGPAASGTTFSVMTITDPSVTDFSAEHGVQINQTIEYLSGGSTVSGTITGVTGNQITVTNDLSLGLLAPDPGTDFTILRQPTGSIEISGNVGEINDIADLELTVDGSTRTIFTETNTIIEARGESTGTTLAAFDSLGAAHQIQLSFFRESGRENGPTIYRYYAESADDSDGERLIGSGTIAFSGEGRFQATGTTGTTISLDLAPGPSPGTGVTTPLTIDLDFSRMTQFEGDSQVGVLEQDGFRAGTLRRFAVSNNGEITGSFDNGISRPIGQVALARFSNPNGLIDLGGNFFGESPSSGNAQIGAASTLGFGEVRGGALEESNVDLADEFTELLVGQRAFQANARTITTSDTLLQELVNLI